MIITYFFMFFKFIFSCICERNLNNKNHRYVLMLFLLIILIFFLMQDKANYYQHQLSLINLREYQVYYCFDMYAGLIYFVPSYSSSSLISCLALYGTYSTFKAIVLLLHSNFSSLLNVKETLCPANCNY